MNGRDVLSARFIYLCDGISKTKLAESLIRNFVSHHSYDDPFRGFFIQSLVAEVVYAHYTRQLLLS